MSWQVEISPKMIKEVCADWQRENPNRDLSEMTKEEFSRRMMLKVERDAKEVLDA